MLAARGVETVDLRPALIAARTGGNVYLMHDTHWTDRGALAAFNAIVEADGHPDWRLDARSALAPPSQHKGGDLFRMLGLEDRATETVEELKLPRKATPTVLSDDAAPDYLLETGEPGPTILILGNSFTQADFPQMLSQHAGRVVWLHYRHCAFDWKLDRKVSPRRSLVDADRARPLLRTRGKASQLPLSECGAPIA